VVHMTGGVIAFVGAKLLGPRIGKYGKDGKPRPIPGHNLTMVVVGTFILAFGWFGFNAGSTLSGTDTQIAVIAVNTMLASAAGAFLGFAWSSTRFGKPDVSWLCNGMLAGLVAITAPCAFVSAPVAVLIGAIAGVLVIESALFIERTLKVDDPVGAVAVHGVNGAFGILAVGLFANGTYGDGLNGVEGPVKGLFYGDASQLVASSIAIGVNILWVGGVSFVALKVIDKIVGLRVSADDEIAGLDEPEMGTNAFPEDLGTVTPIDPPVAEPVAGGLAPAMVEASPEPA